MPNEVIIAVCKSIDGAIQARMDWLKMLTPEQRAQVLDMEVKGQKVAFDIFVEPIIELVNLIKEGVK